MGLFVAKYDYKALDGDTKVYELYQETLKTWHNAPMYVHLVNLEPKKFVVQSLCIRQYSALVEKLNNHFFDVMAKRRNSIEQDDDPKELLGSILQANASKKEISENQAAFLKKLPVIYSHQYLACLHSYLGWISCLHFSLPDMKQRELQLLPLSVVILFLKAI